MRDKNRGARRTAMLLGALALVMYARVTTAEDTGRDERIRHAEELLGQEPSFADTTQAVIRFHSVDPQTIRQTLRRIRSKSAVPYVRASNRFEQTRLNRTLHEPGANYTVINSDEEFLGTRDWAVAMVAYDLPQSVFNTAELQTYQQTTMQAYFMRLMNRFFYRRQQLLLAFLIDPPTDPRAHDHARLRILGYTSLINTFTGGWFLENLPEGSF